MPGPLSAVIRADAKPCIHRGSRRRSRANASKVIPRRNSEGQEARGAEKYFGASHAVFDRASARSVIVRPSAPSSSVLEIFYQPAQTLTYLCLPP
jgi:hypothetical protein